MYSDDDNDPNDFGLDESFYSDGEEEEEEYEFDMDNDEQDKEVEVDSLEEMIEDEDEKIKPNFGEVDSDFDVDKVIEDEEIDEVFEDKEIEEVVEAISDDSIDIREEISDDILSSNAILIKEKLTNIDEIQDKNKISILIENAIQKIKNDKLINKIKNNRINFFATLNYN